MTTFTAFTAISASGKACHCDTSGSMFMAKCEGRMRVSADGRTLTFNDFKAGLGDAPTATGSFTGNAVVVGVLRLQLATGTPATASRCKPSPTPPATSRTSVWA